MKKVINPNVGCGLRGRKMKEHRCSKAVVIKVEANGCVRDANGRYVSLSKVLGA